MGLFSLLTGRSNKFAPDPNETEYENLLNFVSCGGTTKEWEKLKAKNGWQFRESEVEKFERYLKEVKVYSDRYYKQMQEIQNDWSVMYNTGAYTGILAINFEKKCIANIADYVTMRKIDIKYGQKTATNIPAFKRLAMLYEKQERFNDAVEVCKQAYALGMDERGRMARMIKKAGRTPSMEEEEILNKA